MSDVTTYYEGKLVGQGLSFGIVVGRFNSLITQQLLEGALDALVRHGVERKNIHVARVPGAYEIPLFCRRMAKTGKFDAVIALGAVIRGGTPHFDYVASEVAKGVLHASWDTDVPVAFGVLTTDSIEQAIERAGTKAGNKGAEAAMSALESAQLMKVLV